MVKNNLLIILLLLFSQNFSGFAQEATDSLPKERKIKKAKLYFAFDASRSLIREPNVKFNGFKIGVELQEKHRLGISFHGLSEPVRFKGRINRKEYPEATDTLFFNFNYASIFYDYVWLRTKRWELTSPIHLGSGNIEISYQDTTGRRRAPFLSNSTVMVGFGGSAQFKVFRWFALGAGAGYRQMLTRDENIGKSLNAPFYQFQLKILVGEIFRMAFRRETLEEW